MTPNDLLVANQVADRLEELHRGKQFHSFQKAVAKAIFKDGYKRIFVRKGRKGGGTELPGLYVPVRIAGTLPNKSCYIIGPTQRLESEVLWDNRRLHNYFPKEWGAESNEKDKRIRLPNGSFVKVEGANDPDAARGWEADCFIWDEYKDQNPLSMEACYPNVMARDGIWVVIGTPPTKKENHYYQLEQQIKHDKDWKVFHWTSWDNPFLPGGHEYLKKEKEKYYARGDWDQWEIEYEANYVFNARRKVLPNFTEENKQPRAVLLERLKRDARHVKWLTIVDPGYATCFGVLFVGYNPYTAEMFRLDEIYSLDRSKNSVRDMWPLIESKQKELYLEGFKGGKWTTVYDSAALFFHVEVTAFLREQGRKTKIVPCSKAPSDEDDYFRAINGSYKMGRSWTALECVNYIREAENYETDEHDSYPDEQNHLLDCDRYGYKFVNYTQNLKLESVEVANKEPRGYTPEDDRMVKQKNTDLVGFGGVDAMFDPSLVIQ